MTWRAGTIAGALSFFLAGADGCAMYSVESVDAPPEAPAVAVAEPPAQEPGTQTDIEEQRQVAAKARVEPPWQPPEEPIMAGLDGAAQLLARGEPHQALNHLAGVDFDGIEQGSEEWHRGQVLLGRAHFQAGELEQGVAAIEKSLAQKSHAKFLPVELVGYELARGRLRWAEELSAAAEREEADQQRKQAARELSAALEIKPNRIRHAIRVEQARALAAVEGSDEDKSRRRAAKRAAKALERVIADYPNHPDVGQLRLELARAHVRSKQVELAAGELRRIHIERAGEPESAAAWADLESLAAESKKVSARRLSSAEKLEQATHARSLRRVELSRQILDEMIADETLGASMKRRAMRSRSWTAYKQRDFEACAADLRALYERTPSIENRDNLSRCLERGRMYDEAIELWLTFADKKSRGVAANALWKAVELAFRGGEYERTDELLKRYAKQYKGKGEDRRWIAAWVAYRLGDSERAIEGFAEVERRDSSRRTTARYFRGKLLLESEDDELRVEGKDVLMDLVEQGDREIVAIGVHGGWPIYYGLMARQRLLDAGHEVPDPPKIDPLPVDHHGFAETQALLSSMRDEYGEASLGLVRAEQLHGIGWLDEARRELRVAADEYINSRKKMLGRSVRTSRTEAHVAGLGWRAEWNAPKLYLGKQGRKILRDDERSREFREGLRTLSVALDEPNRAAKLVPYGELPYRSRWHPRPYRQAIEREADLREVPPTHLWSLMYTESRFRRHVVSHVGARGALQIMPWTARQLQERLGEFDGRLDPDILYDIDANAHLAAYYVGELMHKFHGQAPMAYASYNGGPSNVARWLDAKAKGPRPLGLDDFVEEIPFRETHRYTRRVMEVQAVYSLMYEGELPRWSNVVDTSVEDNIDF